MDPVPSVFLSSYSLSQAMEYPLIDKQLLSSLRLVHGIFNLIVMLLFFYHGRLGIAIRRARKDHRPLPFPVIRRHRKGGPILAAFGLTGYTIGFVLVLLDTGNILEYPAHFFVGTMIVLLIFATVVISVKIKGQDSPYRTPHFMIGVTILTLYVIQCFLGIGALF